MLLFVSVSVLVSVVGVSVIPNVSCVGVGTCGDTCVISGVLMWCCCRNVDKQK